MIIGPKLTVDKTYLSMKSFSGQVSQSEGCSSVLSIINSDRNEWRNSNGALRMEKSDSEGLYRKQTFRLHAEILLPLCNFPSIHRDSSLRPSYFQKRRRHSYSPLDLKEKAYSMKNGSYIAFLNYRASCLQCSSTESRSSTIRTRWSNFSDLNCKRRKAVLAQIERDAKETLAKEIIDDVVEQVRTPTPPPPNIRDPLVFCYFFENNNKKLRLVFSYFSSRSLISFL